MKKPPFSSGIYQPAMFDCQRVCRIFIPLWVGCIRSNYQGGWDRDSTAPFYMATTGFHLNPIGKLSGKDHLEYRSQKCSFVF